MSKNILVMLKERKTLMDCVKFYFIYSIQIELFS